MQRRSSVFLIMLLTKDKNIVLSDIPQLSVGEKQIKY